ncbi:uncharacterized protein LOC119734723 [Patiria miniata]|uniref:Uncharacterized protein n=1 Tax=Patiria miniata TaxID=46514 RepID=A0A914AJM5_PATMI|nr:uncharacterized protein LOC119734723 [Patiria miniata]
MATEVSEASEYRTLLLPPSKHGRIPSFNCYYSTPIASSSQSQTGETSPRVLARKIWPWTFWLLLKFIGLYNYRRIVTQRRCDLCRLAVLQRRYRERGEEERSGWLYPGAVDEQTDETEAEKEVPMICVLDADINPAKGGTGAGDAETTDGCQVCRSMWWDSGGLCRPYSETDIGVCEWNHRGSTVLSVIWSLVLFAFTLFEMSLKIEYLGGKKRDLVPFISYATHIFFNMSIPALILLTNFRHMQMDRRRLRRVHGFRWWKALSIRYIVRRVQHLEMGYQLPCRGFLTVCLSWPLFNGMYSLIFYVTMGGSLWQAKLSLVFSVVCMIVWGAFCYLVLLLRLAFLQQQRLELGFLWKHVGEVDICRRQLAMYAEDLGSMRRLVSIWIIMVAAISSWAFSSLLYWEYMVISGGFKVKHDYFVAFNINIWSTNTMFLALPLLAVGGVDLKGTWSQFKQSISQMRCESHDVFWDKILAFCEEQSPVTRVKMLTLMFSALGLFLGLHLSMEDQDVYMPTQETYFLTPLDNASYFTHS